MFAIERECFGMSGLRMRNIYYINHHTIQKPKANIIRIDIKTKWQ